MVGNDISICLNRRNNTVRYLYVSWRVPWLPHAEIERKEDMEIFKQIDVPDEQKQSDSQN